VATYRVRFFTPVHEVDLCGHATIATWTLMHQQGLPKGTYTQETKAGILGISVEGDDLIFMEQAKAEFHDVIPASSLAPLLGITEQDFDPTLKPQVVSTGFRDVLVPLKDKATLSRLMVDLPGIVELSQRYRTGGLHVFTLLGSNMQSTTSARNFGPIDGIDEEAATGTSSGALLCYLRKYGRLADQDLYRLEQGEDMGRLSYIYGRFIKGVIWVGGAAALMKKLEVEVT
jgi:PhzF family phenazine biosynthesis protein